MMDRLKGFWRGLKAGPDRAVSLVSSWLANALWLIEAKFLPLAQRAYGQNEVVYACLRLLSSGVAEPPLVAYTENAGGAREPLDRQHPLAMLIRRPNELMTEYEFWELTALHMGIVGRSVWWKERNNAGVPIALWPLRPDRVGYVYSSSDKPGERLLLGYSYADPGTGRPVMIPRRDALAFNFPNPAGESGGIVEGIGPIEVLARQVAADNEATKFVGALLANYAAPSVVLSVKAPIKDENEARLIKQHFRAEFGGANVGMPALLDGETKIDQVGFNPRQLEFSAIRDVSEARISSALGVPAVLVGLSVGLREMTYNNVSGMRRYFAETTLANLWRRFSDQYESDVASEFGEGIIVEFDLSQVRALAANRQEALQPIVDGFGKGAATRNEYRQALGLDPVPGGDVFLVPATMLETPVEVEEPAVRAFALPGYRAVEVDGPPITLEGRSNGHKVEALAST